MSKYKNIRKLTIFTLIAVIAVLTVSAVIVAAVIHNNPKNGTIQEATAAYDRYCADQDDADQRTLYMIYHADGGFAALCNGVVRGVYDSEEAAMQAMAGMDLQCFRITEVGEQLFAVECSDEVLQLCYDDRYDVSGKTVEILDAGLPVSYKIDEDAAAGTPDDAVITLDGNRLIATGIGTATVMMDGTSYKFVVTPAPISLFMITGHSIGMGQKGSIKESVVGPEGQVYSSYGPENLSSKTAGVGISYGAKTRATQINAFTASGRGTKGEGSALAWQWNNLTGEKVWIVNTAVGGSHLKEWIPGTENYKNAVTQFKRAQKILSNEIKAGHYYLSAAGILYHNGANFSYKGVTFTQAELKTWYEAMWNGFKKDLSTDMDGNGTKETVSFLGIVPIWTKTGGHGYSADEPAGMFMAASAAYEDIFTASTIGKNWLLDKTVESDFPEITYQTQNGEEIKRPTTVSEVYATDKVHYKQVAYNALGVDIADNLYRYLKGEPEKPTVKLVHAGNSRGMMDRTVLTDLEALIVVPVVDPQVFSKLDFSVEGMIEMEYPLALKATGNGTGKLIVSYNGEVIEELRFVCKTRK